MVIAPNTTIWLLKDVPLDDTFDHTLYWEASGNKTAQQVQRDWFLGQTNGFVKYTKENLTYQRVEKGECMIEVNNASENIYDCNYLVFINASFENKYFYCFLQDVEYVNNRTYKVRFKVDVMQTFYFDYDLIPCFIERQHVELDVLGENIQEEHIETGPYWQDEIKQVDLGESYIVVCGNVRPRSGVTHGFTRDDIEDYGGGGQYSGVYSGTIYNVFRYPITANEFLSAVTDAGKADAIVNVFMAPKLFFAENPTDYGRANDEYEEHGFVGGLRGSGGYSGGSLGIVPAQETVEQVTLPTSIGTHTVRNYKLFCWPYCMLTVTNNNGISADYRHEFFTPQQNGYLLFKIVLALSAQPEACIYPMYYNHVVHNFMEKIVINDFPQCSYAVDAYRAWIAQNRYTLMGSAVTDLTTAATGLAVAGISGPVGLGVAVHGFNSVFSKMAQIKQASTMPPHAKGQQTNTMMMALERQGFHIYRTRVTDYYAEIIDQYFDRFGYVANRLGVPNRKVRNHFTYCKTRNCDINAKGMPDKYVKQIKEIYDNGITFWCDTNKNHVGQYTFTICNDNQAPHVRPAPEQNNG